MYPKFNLLGYFFIFSYVGSAIIYAIAPKTSMLFYRYTTIIEGVFYSLFLHSLLQSRTAKRILLICILLFFCYSLFDLFQSKGATFDSIASVLVSLIIISFCVFYLYEKMSNPDSLFLYNSPYFWIVAALLLYFSGIFFANIYAQNFSKSREVAKTFWTITSYLAFIQNILFLIAFIIAKKPDKTLKNQSNT
jgi:hypothetical protein